MVDDFDFEVTGKYEVTLPDSSDEKVSEAIQARLLDLDPSELFMIAADANESSRARWVAMCRLPAVEKQRLSDTLVLRRDDHRMWSAIEFCPPTNSDAAILALRGHLDSVNSSHRRAAIRALFRMGDVWAESEVDAMLTGDNPEDHLFAIHCVAELHSESANVRLRTYLNCDSNPINVRVEVAGLMLRKGGVDVLPFLYRVADWKIETAYYAATAVKHHNRLAGLQLYGAILAIPDHPATPITVLDICMNADCNFTGVEPADQLAEARRLLAKEIAKAQQQLRESEL